MTRLYRCRANRSELAALFDCEASQRLEWGSMQWPGLAAPVVCETNGMRQLELMSWGLPRPDGEAGDSLRSTERDFHGRLAFHDKAETPGRCIIPADSFAVPDGEEGRRTRTWFGLWDEPIFGWGGLWRWTTYGKRGFVGATTEANAIIGRVATSMPVILSESQFETWLSGELVDVMRLWRDMRLPEDFWMEQTEEIWAGAKQRDQGRKDRG